MTRSLAKGAWLLVCVLLTCGSSQAVVVPGDTVVHDRIVKIYGAGGLQGLEAYQTGLLVSPDGLVLTVDSTVLDEGEALIVLSDGVRTTGRLTASDPLTGTALLRIDGFDDANPHFELARQSLRLPIGAVVVAVSNAFNIAQGNEPFSWQRGVISEYAPFEDLDRPGAYPTEGMVLITDITTSNPGAAGGALLASDGELLGMIGAETRSSSTGAWRNYVIPVDLLDDAMRRMLGSLANRAASPTEETAPPAVIAVRLRKQLGVALAPRLSARTPPFVEHVATDSLAAEAGLRSDDLLTTVNGRMSNTVEEAARALFDSLERKEPCELTVIRGSEIVRITIRHGEPGS